MSSGSTPDTCEARSTSTPGNSTMARCLSRFRSVCQALQKQVLQKSKTVELALQLDAYGRVPSHSSRCAGVDRTAMSLGDKADMPRRPSGIAQGQWCLPLIAPAPPLLASRTTNSKTSLCFCAMEVKQDPRLRLRRSDGSQAGAQAQAEAQ